jgi:predicted Zn-dependent protease
MELESPASAEAEFERAMERTRWKLRTPEVQERTLPAILAAAFFAVAALVFATASIVAPATAVTPAAKRGVQ